MPKNVTLVIDGQEIELVPNGESKNFEKFKEPDTVKGDIIANAYIKRDWKAEEVKGGRDERTTE